MNQKLPLVLGLLLLSACSLFSQSVYSVKYNFRTGGDSTTYYGFLLRFEDGSGLLRIRFVTAGSEEDQVMEMDLEEQAVLDKTGIPDAGRMQLQAVNPRVISGNGKLAFPVPIFTFTYQTATDYFEPSSVSYADKNAGIISGSEFTASLLDRSSISKPFVRQFFSDDDDFFIRLFTSSSRGLTLAEKKIQLHLIAVADTLDKNIGPACSKDLQRITETFRSISNFLGIQFNATTLWGSSFSKKNTENVISKLRPGSKDIVVFYYSGHGFRKEEEKQRFPFIKLKTFHTSKKDVYANSLNIEKDIFDKIRRKPSRLNLVLSDCCNNDIITTNAVGTKPGKTKSSGIDWSEDNLRTLFLNDNPMSILAVSAQNGQRAASNNDFGSFFSYFFKLSIENHCSKLQRYATWDVVLQDAQKQTTFKARHTYCDKPFVPENICRQNPDYKIVFGTGN
jgi:hypothetical protein